VIQCDDPYFVGFESWDEAVHAFCDAPGRGQIQCLKQDILCPVYIQFSHH
jgi:hypothetical protein